MDWEGSRVSTDSSRWQILLNASRQVLFAFHSGDSIDLTMACEVLRDIAEAVFRLSQVSVIGLVGHKLAVPALMVASVAALTSLAGPDVEQTSLSGPTLSFLVTLTRRVCSTSHSAVQAAPNGKDESRLELQNQVALLDDLANLPPATGILASDVSSTGQC